MFILFAISIDIALFEEANITFDLLVSVKEFFTKIITYIFRLLNNKKKQATLIEREILKQSLKYERKILEYELWLSFVTEYLSLCNMNKAKGFTISYFGRILYIYVNIYCIIGTLLKFTNTRYI